ncbi:MAG: FixH family protein [Bacteroidales bacterium]|nr:FixH family protein [Bacteroidales bacterium]
MKILYILNIILIAFIFSSCEREDQEEIPSPLEELTILNEGYATGAAVKVEIWGEKNYFAGYNELTVVLYDSLNPSEKISHADIQFNPLMTMNMGMMSHVHSCPFENPVTPTTDDIFNGAIAFIMPTMESGAWKLELHVDNHHNGKKGHATFDITVDSPDDARIKSFISEKPIIDTFFVALIEPNLPKVGINDIEFAVFSRNGAMDFPAVENLSIDIEPEMPSMGHGSPNNENPVHDANGHYMGKVNFTMTGWWRVHLSIKHDEMVMNDNMSFDITF